MQEPASSSTNLRAASAEVSVKDATKAEAQVDFREIAFRYGTDKVLGWKNLPPCLENPEKCHEKEPKNPKCRCFGHFYDTLY